MTIFDELKHKIHKHRSRRGLWEDPPNILDKHWKVGEVIGGRGKGTVCTASGEEGESAVVKFVHSPRTSHFGSELMVYHLLRRKGFPAGFARLLSSGRVGKIPYIILQRLGLSLARVLEKGKRFTVRAAASICIQIISCLETMHSLNVTHGSLSEAHVVFEGDENDCSKVHLVDFSAAHLWNSPTIHNAVPTEPGGRVGHDLSSVSRHDGLLIGPRDDIEQVAYLFVKLVRGALPWSQIASVKEVKSQTHKKLAKLKRSLRLSGLWNGLPRVMSDWMKYVVNLKSDQTPDYNWLRDQLRTVARGI